MDYLEVILDAILPLLITLLSVLIGYGISYLRRKTEELESEATRKLLQSAIEEVDKVAMDAVLATQQVLTDNLKARAEDGKLTKEEARECLNYAVDYFWNHISRTTLNLLPKLSKDIQQYIEQLIEAKLGELKLVNKV